MARRWAGATILFGRATVPAGLNNLVAVAGGEYYSLALKNNGTVAAWGVNISRARRMCRPGLNNVVTIAGGTYSSLALQNNGSGGGLGRQHLQSDKRAGGLEQRGGRRGRKLSQPGDQERWNGHGLG